MTHYPQGNAIQMNSHSLGEKLCMIATDHLKLQHLELLMSFTQISKMEGIFKRNLYFIRD